MKIKSGNRISVIVPVSNLAVTSSAVEMLLSTFRLRSRRQKTSCLASRTSTGKISGIRSGKIPAFALQEMIVVLLITTIVVGMAFSVLNLVQRQMGNIEDIYAVRLEANKLRQSLWVDFNRYSLVYFEPKDNQLFFSNEVETKTYALVDGLLVTEKDTFDIALSSAKLYFNNEEQLSGEIDAMEIRTSKESGEQQIFVYKDNTAVTYMNQ